MASVFSATRCRLGEGAFWHPARGQLFWFDILAQRLYSRVGDDEQHWTFDECVSAAGWIDHDHLIIAGASALWRFAIETGARERLIHLEAEDSVTRSNDGRADPKGGFWIGTMGYNLEPGAGAIYRYYRGELRQLYDAITIPNAISFSPDGDWAYFTDTPDGRIFRQRLDPEGWPEGAPVLFADLSGAGFGPDGAVVDAQGCLWNAQWGAGRVACYDPSGAFVTALPVPARQVSCPCFGGDTLATLFVTTAADGQEEDQHAGQTYRIETETRGQPEHRVELG